MRIERVFDAPRAVVFRAWTDHDELKEWFHFNDEWKIEVVDEGYRHAEHRDLHQHGWPGFLDQLDKRLAAARDGLWAVGQRRRR